MSCATVLSGTIGGKSEEESSNLSDKSYCVDALLSFEGDGDGETDGKFTDLHRSHDSEVTALVSNTAAAAAAKEAATKQRQEASPSDSFGKGSESALAELAMLLEHAASLDSVARRRKVRSNSFDSKPTPSTYVPSERTGSMYASAPNLDFFNAFDQDPHLSDTETTDHRGSWWDDSEHTNKIVAGFGKDFEKMHSTFVRRKGKAFSASSTKLRHGDVHGPQKNFEKHAMEASPPEKHEFWLDETESSSERLSHSLHSIRKMRDHQTIKSDGTVKTDFTDMAVAASSNSLSMLSRNPESSEYESETVTTCPVTPTVTSRDSAVSSIENASDYADVALSSPTRAKKVVLRPKSPGRSPKRPSNASTQIGGNEMQTPIVSNRKKKVIKVRAGGLTGNGEMDPAKVQEAVKKWKAAKHQSVSTATGDCVSVGERPQAKQAASSPPSNRLENAGPLHPNEQPNGDVSSRSRRSRTTCEEGDTSPNHTVGRADPNSHATVSKRSSSKSRSTKDEGAATAQSDRPRSKSSSPPDASSRRNDSSGYAERATPRSRSRSKAPQSAESPPEVPPLTPSSTQKRLVRKKASCDTIEVVQQPTSSPPTQASASAGTGRGRSRSNDNVSPLKSLRSLSIGRGTKASLRSVTLGGSTRSSFTAVRDAEQSRARSRSLGKIGNALFRRNHHEVDAPASETGDAKAGSGGGLLASLTNVVSRSSGAHGRQPEPKAAGSAKSARSKSLPRMRQLEEKRAQGSGPEVSPRATRPPVTTSNQAPPSPRRSLHNVSTRAICAAPTTTPSTPRRHRPIPPQDYIPESIDLSPSSSTAVNAASRTSSMDNNEHSVFGAASSSHLAGVDRRQLLERTVSDLSDDALFRRIQSAGVTEEMMNKLREVGLIITEAPSPVSKSNSGARRLSGSSSRPM